ncbi:tRNA methyltransferase, partial [Patescibacteria group bacterium]|nr:tRNA methyltransferase [Patescibacteria group bacterium]
NFPERKIEITVILENIQYAKNVSAMFRTAAGANVKRMILTGISRTPPFGKGLRKVSRGMEDNITWNYIETSEQAINELRRSGYTIIGVELTKDAIPHYELQKYLKTKKKVCFIVGHEDGGINRNTLNICDKIVMIPIYGKGASLNVTVSLGIILYSF